MNRPKPFTYLSLQCVVSYMNATQRILDVPRILGKRFNTIPPRVRTLVLGDSSFSIDGMQFSCGLVVVKSMNKKKLRQIAKREQEGVPYDVDSRGNKDQNLALAPGDIHIGPMPGQGPPPAGAPDSGKVRFFVKCTFECRQRQLKEAIYSRVGTKIRDFIRQQFAKFFPKNRVINVRSLEISINEGVLRLPENLFFRIRKLKPPLSGNVVLGAIQGVIHPRSLPLKKLCIKVEAANDPIFDNVHLRNSGSLHIEQTRVFSLTNRIRALHHKNIQLSGKDIHVATVGAAIVKWRRTAPSFGTKFGVQVEDFNDFTDRLRRFCRIPNGPVRRTRQTSHLAFSITLNYYSQINVYAYHARNHSEEVNRRDLPYTVELEVVPNEDYLYSDQFVEALRFL